MLRITNLLFGLMSVWMVALGLAAAGTVPLAQAASSVLAMTCLVVLAVSAGPPGPGME